MRANARLSLETLKKRFVPLSRELLLDPFLICQRRQSVRNSSDDLMSRKQIRNSSWLVRGRICKPKKLGDQTFRQGARTNVSRCCDDLGLIHTQAGKLHRERSLIPLV